jgi:hypothetical protein
MRLFTNRVQRTDAAENAAIARYIRQRNFEKVVAEAVRSAESSARLAAALRTAGDRPWPR